jgi:hypothetical protein
LEKILTSLIFQTFLAFAAVPRIESLDWRIDYLLDSSSVQVFNDNMPIDFFSPALKCCGFYLITWLSVEMQTLDEPSVQLHITTSHELNGAVSQPTTFNVEMNPEKLSLLLHGEANLSVDCNNGTNYLSIIHCLRNQSFELRGK